MIEVTFSINAACALWHGDNDITIEVSEEEYAVLQQAISDAKEAGWSYLNENGPCASLFPRIHEAVMESLEETDLELELDEVEFMVRIPEELKIAEYGKSSC